jgi:hypothetical protein
MKFPKEGDKDNDIAEWINRIPYFDNLTINEVSMLLMMLFSNLFHFISAISRLIDVNPTESIKIGYKNFNKKTFKSHFLCEMLYT